MPVKGGNGSGDLRKPHFRYIAGRNAESIQHLGCVELRNFPEIVSVKVFPCVKTKAGHYHIGNAVRHKPAVSAAYIILPDIFKEAVVQDFHKVIAVIHKVIGNSVLCRRQNGAFKGIPAFQLPEGAFQGVYDFPGIFRLHLPNGDGAGIAAFVGIGNIKVVHQPLAASVHILEYGDTPRSPVDPSAEAAVPTLDFKDCGCVRSLGVNQKLLVKTEFEVVAGRA
ncbi:MAG: hypothetical protein NC548_11970 [Lachnospiraceae bacterium]|nr:hypothetical protein [Lachnospiraceae bacterium]